MTPQKRAKSVTPPPLLPPPSLCIVNPPRTHSSSYSAPHRGVTTARVAPRAAPMSIDHLREAYESETEQLKNAFMLYLSNDLVRNKGPMRGKLVKGPGTI